jgi:hypothetical protein
MFVGVRVVQKSADFFAIRNRWVWGLLVHWHDSEKLLKTVMVFHYVQ